MTRGPKPNPAGLRVAAGTNKKDPGRENPDTPKPTGELGTPPKTISKEAQAVWLEDAPYWPDEADRRQFGMYCTAVADGAGFRAILGEDKSGWFYETDKGNLLRHPAAIQYDICLKFANRIANEFGMTPTSRNRVKAPKPRRSNPADRHFRKGKG